MRLFNWIIGTSLAIAALLAAPAFAAQGALCLPTTGVYSGLTAATYMNLALKALETQNSGAGAPGNDCTFAPVVGQAWLNTNASPYPLEYFDGTSWQTIGTFDTSTHKFTSTAYGLKLSGSSSGTTTLQPAATASGTLTLPAATDTLVGKATTDNLQNKTFADPSDATKVLALGLSGITTGNTRTLTIPDASGTVLLSSNAPASTSGRLTYVSSTQVCFKPYRGNIVSFPSGAISIVGSSGVCSTITSASLNGTAGQTLSASTLYYAYLWNNSGTLTLDWSTTSHATDTTTGIEIKSGDSTRVLEGMAYPTSGPIFQDGLANRLVASWNNRLPRKLASTFTTTRSTNSSTYVEINTEIRVNFLSWGDAANLAFATVTTSNSGADQVYSAASLDGAISGTDFFPSAGPGTSTGGMTSAGTCLPSEGFHYATVVGRIGASTANWFITNGASVLSALVTS